MHAAIMQEQSQHPEGDGRPRETVLFLGACYCVIPLFWFALEPQVFSDPQNLAYASILLLGPLCLMSAAAFWYRRTRAVSVLLWLGMSHATLVATILFLLGLLVMFQTWPFLGFLYFIAFAGFAYFIAFATYFQWRKRGLAEASDREDR